MGCFGGVVSCALTAVWTTAVDGITSVIAARHPENIGWLIERLADTLGYLCFFFRWRRFDGAGVFGGTPDEVDGIFEGEGVSAFQEAI